MSEVDGREIAEAKQASFSDDENQAVVDAVAEAAGALEDLVAALNDAGFDFGDGDGNDPESGMDEDGNVTMTMVPAKAAAIRESVKSMQAVLEEAREELGADTKRGRVLSRANENKLRRMRDEIDSVLAQLNEDDEDEDGKGAEVETDDDLDLDTKTKPTNLRTAEGDASCATCVHWREKSEKAVGGMGFCSKYDFPTKANQVSDGYEKK
jgi:hypothetical protein